MGVDSLRTPFPKDRMGYLIIMYGQKIAAGMFPPIIVDDWTGLVQGLVM